MPHNLCRLCSLALLLLLAALTEAARPSPRGVPRKPAVKPAAKPAAERGFRFFSIAVGGDKSPSKRPKAVRAPASKKAAADSQSLIDIDIGRQLNALREQMADFRPVQVFSGFALATVLFGSSLAFTGSAINGFMEEVDSNGPVLERTLQFGTILESVMSGYVDKNVDLNQLFETGVNAMLSTLDPYSEYESIDESADMTARTTGRYGGVGITIGSDGEDVIVLSALEGFAYDAGVRPGDRIVAINGVEVRQQSKKSPESRAESVKAMLRGEPGTSVALTVERDGATQPTLTMPVKRQIVRVPDVTLASVDKASGVGFIKLEGFSEGTAREMHNAIRGLQQVTELNALVLDVRNNPGGLLDAAVEVSQQLVPEATEIVTTSGRIYGEGTSLVYKSTRPPLLSPRARLVVLVNANTASAAEIVTGVVQDTDRGVVVGERTYGKGLVQVVEPLPLGGALKLTVAKYYTPSGRCIQAVDYAGGRLEAKAVPPAAASAPTTGKAAAGGDAGGAADDVTSKEGAPTAEAPTAVEATPTSRNARSKPRSASPSTSPSASTSASPSASTSGLASTASGRRLLRSTVVDASEPLAAGSGDAAGRGAVAGGVQRLDASEPSRPSASVPDTSVRFVTEHGRAVSAGGGIAPDVIVEGRQLGELERALLRRGDFFEFSGKWLQRHAGAPEDLEKLVVRAQGDAYREFEKFVRARAAGDENTPSLAPSGLDRQLDALEKSLAREGGAAHSRSTRELATLRRSLIDEMLEDFKTEQPTLQRDLTEALLGRLTSPTDRLAAQLADDPQVNEALAIADDAFRYNRMLAPDPELVAARAAEREAAPAELSLLFPLS